MRVNAAPSPNFNDRDQSVDMLVLHYTGMETGQAALERMSDPAAEVSAHYMVWEDGTISQLVGEDKRAWHAGIAHWQGDSNINSRSIGVEIVNGGHDWPQKDGTLPPFPEAQIEAVIELCQGILGRWTIPHSRIVGHSDIAPTRKADPGEHFPWKRLAEAGIGLWPKEAGDEGADPDDFELLLSNIGYDMSVPGAAVKAFQRRFRPERVTGDAGETTLGLISAVHRLYCADVM